LPRDITCFGENHAVKNPLPPSVSKVLLVKEKEEIFWELRYRIERKIRSAGTVVAEEVCNTILF
jgi:hypothetical protein